MIANLKRGEVAAQIDGEARILRLTLGALVELEEALGEDLASFAARIERDGLTARDALRVNAAALRGGGGSDADEAVARAEFEGGPVGAIALAGQVLAAAFAR